MDYFSISEVTHTELNANPIKEDTVNASILSDSISYNNVLFSDKCHTMSKNALVDLELNSEFSTKSKVKSVSFLFLVK